MVELGITNETYIANAIAITGVSLLPELKLIPGIAGNDTAYDMVVLAGQTAYAESYVYVYYVSIAFGSVAIACACGLGNIQRCKYSMFGIVKLMLTFAVMDNHVAVVM